MFNFFKSFHPRFGAQYPIRWSGQWHWIWAGLPGTRRTDLQLGERALMERGVTLLQFCNFLAKAPYRIAEPITPGAMS